MTITLPPELEHRLLNAAAASGVDANTLVKRLLVEHLPGEVTSSSLAELFAAWEVSDGTDDPQELARREQELAAFKQAMNQNRRHSEGEGSRTPYP